MFLWVDAGPKRPLGCGSISIFGTAAQQLQQDLLTSTARLHRGGHARNT